MMPKAKSKKAPASKLAVVRPSPAAEAIRDELRKLLDDDAFGVAQLTKIELIASSGKALLQATQGYAHRDRQKLLFGLGSNSYIGPDSEMIDMPASSATLPGSTQETYGAAALRELGSVVKQITSGQKRGRMEVLRELSLARREGMDDIAAELKQELEDLKNIDERYTGDKPGVTASLAQGVMP